MMDRQRGSYRRSPWSWIQINERTAWRVVEYRWPNRSLECWLRIGMIFNVTSTTSPITLSLSRIHLSQSVEYRTASPFRTLRLSTVADQLNRYLRHLEQQFRVNHWTQIWKEHWQSRNEFTRTKSWNDFRLSSYWLIHAKTTFECSFHSSAISEHNSSASYCCCLVQNYHLLGSNYSLNTRS